MGVISGGRYECEMILMRLDISMWVWGVGGGGVAWGVDISECRYY